MAPRKPDPTVRTVQAGLLAWVLPGAGHYMLGHRAMGIVLFAAVTFPYLTGLACGGILDSVNPYTNRWLLLAELGVGGYTTPCFLVSQSIESSVQSSLGMKGVPEAGTPDHAKYVAARARYMSFYPESDIAQIYLATAGLLNVLAILDAISRAQTGGLPTFHRELQTAGGAEGTP